MTPFGSQSWGRGAGDFVGIVQASVQLPDLLTSPWAQHLKWSGTQAVLAGRVFSSRETRLFPGVHGACSG